MGLANAIDQLEEMGKKFSERIPICQKCFEMVATEICPKCGCPLCFECLKKHACVKKGKGHLTN